MTKTRAVALAPLGIALWAFSSGCSSTAHLNKEATTDIQKAVFAIGSTQAGDPIDVAGVITEHLQSKGFEVHRKLDQVPAAKAPEKPQDQSGACFGSGFFIAEDGVFITNDHVVEGASSVALRLTTGEIIEATVIATDKKNDIVILRPKTAGKIVPYWVKLAKFREAKIGDKVGVIGYPFGTMVGKKPRLTDGIISSDAGMQDDPTRFQISAPIQPGNSGGPVLNTNQEVIGVATAKLSDGYFYDRSGSVPQNVNFGVKIDYARMLFDKSVEESVAAQPSKVCSIENALDATALVMVNTTTVPETLPEPKPMPKPERRVVVIHYSYNYVWDVFHYTLTSFNMQWVDAYTGEIIASANHGGASFSSAESIVKSSINKLLKKANIER